MMFYNNLKEKGSLTEWRHRFFDIVVAVLQWGTLAMFVFTLACVKNIFP